MEPITESDTVALLKSIPAHKLSRGDVGTVVMLLSDEVAEVEFADSKGRSISVIPIALSSLMKLRFDLAETFEE